MYFTSGSLIRNLFRIQKETGLTKQQIVDKYIFMGGGGQCGPCRFGMYPQEYLKVVNEAGFKGFRILIFSADASDAPQPRGAALPIDLSFKVNLVLAAILADMLHVAECALRPYAKDRQHAMRVLDEAEKILLEAYRSPYHLIMVPRALRRVGRMFASVERHAVRLPLIFIAGEFFANLAHGDPNYDLRRFICDEGCEVIPGLFTQVILFDNYKRLQEARSGLMYARTRKERLRYTQMYFRQKISRAIVRKLFHEYREAVNPESFGGRLHIHDMDELTSVGAPYYHPHIFGGEGNLEIAEALYYADKVDGFISVKPFGCMPSSGVSDGVQFKVMSLHPNLNFLSIETSGDNDISILSRVSMLLFKAKQKVALERRAVEPARVSGGPDRTSSPIPVNTRFSESLGSVPSPSR